MMEIVLIVLLLISLCINGYLFGQWRLQKSSLDYLRPELREWQNVALAKEGIRPLGYKPPEKKESDGVAVTPRPVLRSELAARDKAVKPAQTTIFANGVRPPNREEVLKQAQEIIDAT